jgi:hypothetical protein
MDADFVRDFGYNDPGQVGEGATAKGVRLAIKRNLPAALVKSADPHDFNVSLVITAQTDTRLWQIESNEAVLSEDGKSRAAGRYPTRPYRRQFGSRDGPSCRLGTHEQGEAFESPSGYHFSANALQRSQ